jgi:hypothetical protein
MSCSATATVNSKKARSEYARDALGSENVIFFTPVCDGLASAEELAARAKRSAAATWRARISRLEMIACAPSRVDTSARSAVSIREPSMAEAGRARKGGQVPSQCHYLRLHIGTGAEWDRVDPGVTRTIKRTMTPSYSQAFAPIGTASSAHATKASEGGEGPETPKLARTLLARPPAIRKPYN